MPVVRIHKSIWDRLAPGELGEADGEHYSLDVQYVRARLVELGAIPRTPRGPGTELKALLKTIGIVAKPNCSCNKRAKIMDEKGCDWCEEHLDEIDGWLAEEAGKRKLPYLSLAGKTLIRLAIRRARKKGNSH